MNVIPLLGILLVVTSFSTKLPGASKWAAATLVVIVVQLLLAIVAFGTPVVGGLHGLNAFVVLTPCADRCCRRSRATSMSTTCPSRRS
jgi:hypothetical protein